VTGVTNAAIDWRRVHPRLPRTMESDEVVKVRHAVKQCVFEDRRRLSFLRTKWGPDAGRSPNPGGAQAVGTSRKAVRRSAAPGHLRARVESGTRAARRSRTRVDSLVAQRQLVAHTRGQEEICGTLRRAPRGQIAIADERSRPRAQPVRARGARQQTRHVQARRSPARSAGRVLSPFVGCAMG